MLDPEEDNNDIASRSNSFATDEYLSSTNDGHSLQVSHSSLCTEIRTLYNYYPVSMV